MNSKLFFALALPLTLPLSLGMFGPQVATLQKILNENPATEVTSAGPGSPGNETGYFGSLTAAAVGRFQNLYAGDILAPAGLSMPTGFVGPLTLAKLNSLGVAASPVVSPAVSGSASAAIADPLAAYRVATSSAPDIYVTDDKITQIQNSLYSTINNAIAAHQAPQINSSQYTSTLAGATILEKISTQSGLPGTSITIQAQNLDAGTSNTIYFELVRTGQVFVLRDLALSATADTLSFAMPPLPTGRYDLAISNSHGISNTAFFIILSAQSPKVSISSVTPASIRWNGTLTISGTGFTPTGNEVITEFDTIKNVASPDGRTLSVQIAPQQLKAESAMGTGTLAIPDTVGVVNDNGYTTSPASFSIDI